MTQTPIPRHRTALARKELSKPIRLALNDGLITGSVSVLDYGCGQGEDIRRLRKQDIKCSGWDPAFHPGGERIPSDIVNLGYVVNVIEDTEERAQSLQQAWDLARTALIVSARLLAEARDTALSRFGDGHLTGRETFQKFFDQQELRNWIDQTLGVKSVPAAPGIFYVFREHSEREAFLAARYRRRYQVPRLKRSEALFEEHKELLEPLIEFVSQRGRSPDASEIEGSDAIIEVFGTIRRAFTTVSRVIGDEHWERLRRACALDLLVYLALSRFDGRPKFHQLPEEIRRDVRAFFSTYTNATESADVLLFSLGDQEVIDAACLGSSTGKITPTALYFHESALGALGPIPRIYEGCARSYLGRVDGANIIKLNRQKPQVSYLCYPDFEKDPHPALQSSTSVNLQTFRVKVRHYEHSANPPILHRKDTFVDEGHPLKAKFERLTKQEERWGLYETLNKIGNKMGWSEVLETKRLRLRGHRIVMKK